MGFLDIDFGQLGDVVLSLPALRAIREHFPKAQITVVVGKPGAEVVTLSGYANATLGVDRVSLRDGPKLVSIARIVNLVKALTADVPALNPSPTQPASTVDTSAPASTPNAQPSQGGGPPRTLIVIGATIAALAMAGIAVGVTRRKPPAPPAQPGNPPPPAQSPLWR